MFAGADGTARGRVEGSEGGPPDSGAGLRSAADEDSGVHPDLVVRVLGRLEVEGTTGVIRRRAVQRALVVLAVNQGRPVRSEEMRMLLAQDDTSELSAATLRSELSRLRSVLPAGVLPDREHGGGYGLSEAVRVDWSTFRVLASKSRACEGVDRLRSATEALSLVRGPLLEGGTWHGIDKTVWEIEAAVEALAAETASLALGERQPVVAARAAASGLLALPGSPQLWQLRLRAAVEGSGENRDLLAGRARQVVGAELSGP